MAKALTELTKQGFTLEQTASIADYPKGEIDTIVLPEGVTRLSGRLRNPSVHHIVFPSCIETIDANVFIESSIEELVIEKDEGKLVIGSSAFMDCPCLKRIRLIAHDIEIGEYAFTRVTGVEELVIECDHDVGVIRENAFADAEIKRVNVGVKRIEYRAFSSAHIEELSFGRCFMEIGEEAFAHNPLRHLSLKYHQFDRLGKNAFADCFAHLREFPLTPFFVLEAFFDNPFGDADFVRFVSEKGEGKIVRDDFESSNKRGERIIALSEGILCGYEEEDVDRTLGYEAPQKPKKSFFLFIYPKRSPVKSVDYPLDTLRPSTFQGAENLEEIFLPHVTYLPESAFKGCAKLRVVKAPNAVCVGAHAFEGCENLQTVDMPQVDQIGERAFDGCRSLQNVTFPVASSFRDGCFLDCVNLKSVRCGETKSLSIGLGCFQACPNLEEVLIQEGGRYEVDHNAFMGCRSLDETSFASCGNLSCAEGYLLCEEAQGRVTLLLALPRGRTELRVPEGVNLILAHAFSCCDEVDAIYLPHTVKEIAYHAFDECPADIHVPFVQDCPLSHQALRSHYGESFTNIPNRFYFLGAPGKETKTLDQETLLGLKTILVKDNVNATAVVFKNWVAHTSGPKTEGRWDIGSLDGAPFIETAPNVYIRAVVADILYLKTSDGYRLVPLGGTPYECHYGDEDWGYEEGYYYVSLE